MIQNRILMTCLSTSWGGLEMVSLEFAQECQKKGLNPLFVCFAGSPAATRAKSFGIETLTFPEGISFFAQVFQFRKWIREYGVGRIVVQKLSTLKPLRLALIGLKDVRLFGFAHMNLNVNKKDLFHRFVYSRLNRLIALTPSHKMNLQAHLPLRNEQFVVIPNWVKKDASAPINQRQPGRPFRLAVSSRLDPQKGQDLAVDAIARLRESGFEVELYIFGENTRNETDYEKQLKQKVKDLRLENSIYFKGYVEQLRAAISEMDILLVPSWRETFGRVVIEAMSVGTPVIGSNAGGIPDIIEHGKNGMLFETKNVESLVWTIQELLEDPGLYQKIRAQALSDVKRYDQDKIMGEVLEVLECH